MFVCCQIYVENLSCIYQILNLELLGTMFLGMSGGACVQYSFICSSVNLEAYNLL